MPTFALVVLVAVFALGAAMLLIGIVAGDVVSLALGGVLLVLGARMRRQVQLQAGGPTDASAASAAATDDTGSAAGSEPDAAAAEPPDDGGDQDPLGDVAEDAVIADDGLVLADAEPTTTESVDGAALHGTGYRLQHAGSGESVDGAELRLRRDGAQIVHLVVPPEQHDELQAPEFAPGAPVVLVPHRTPEGRVQGVRVFDETIDHQAGWLPEDVAAEMVGELRRRTVRARSLYEWRDEQGARRQLAVLVHRPDVVDAPTGDGHASD